MRPRCLGRYLPREISSIRIAYITSICDSARLRVCQPPYSVNHWRLKSISSAKFRSEISSYQTGSSASESLSGKSFARSLRNRPRIARILVSCGTRDGGIRSGTKRILGFCLCPESCWGHGKLGSFSFRQVVRRMVGVLILFPCPQDVRTPYSKPSAAGCLAHSTGILMPRLNASPVRLPGWRPSAMA